MKQKCVVTRLSLGLELTRIVFLLEVSKGIGRGLLVCPSRGSQGCRQQSLCTEIALRISLPASCFPAPREPAPGPETSLLGQAKNHIHSLPQCLHQYLHV